MPWEYAEEAGANGYGSVCGVDEPDAVRSPDRCALLRLSCPPESSSRD